MAQPTLEDALVATRRWWRQARAAITTGAHALRSRRSNRVAAALAPAGRRILSAPRHAIEAIGALRAARERGGVPRSAAGAALATIVAERDDDVASVIGKIDTAPAVELALVVPRGVRRLRDPGAWPRLAAHARRHGLTLGVVAARRDVRDLARASGLRAARSLRGLRRRPARRLQLGAREFDLALLQLHMLGRWLAMFALAGAAFVGACYVVPTAEIVIVPPAQPFTSSTTVRVDSTADGPDAVRGVIRGETVRREITSVLATTTSGITEVGDERAAVALVVTNAGDAAFILAAGTRVTNEHGVAFITDEERTIEPDTAASVAATAIQPGSDANLPAGELWTLAELPGTLSAENPEAASGGTDVEVAAVAAEDAARIGAIALGVLRRIGERELEAALEGAALFPETVTVAILSQRALQAVGEPADALLIEFTALVSGLTVSAAQARAYAEAALVEALPDGTVLLPGSAEAELSANHRFEAGTVFLELTAHGLVAELFDPAAVRSDLTGATPAAAAAALRERFALAHEPEVTVRPNWIPWRWLPRRASSITIRLAPPPEDAVSQDDADSAGAEEGTTR